MSVRSVLRCDICNREDSGDVHVKIIRRQFKIKEFGLWNDERNPWKRVDICTDCIQKIGVSVVTEGLKQAYKEKNDE